MRNKEAVLWLTLTDFLIQVIFFGIFLVVGYLVWEKAKETSKPEPVDPARANEYANGAGFSNYVDLTDWLTTMVPADQLRGVFEENARLKADNVTLQEESLQVRKKLRKAVGLPPCPESVNSDDSVRAVVDFIGYDDGIEIAQDTTVFRETILQAIGKPRSEVQRLTFSDFQRVFGKLLVSYPACRFYVHLDQSRTERKFAGDAVESAFFLTARRVVPE